MYVEIVSIPVGEAPLWVRQAWIGTKIPLVWDGLHTLPVVGVLSGPPSRTMRLWNYLTWQADPIMTGYIVVAKEAVDRLADHNIEAAEWWRANTPDALDGASTFIFDAQACEVVCDA